MTALSIIPLTGIPEVAAGDVLARLLLDATDAAGVQLADGDVLVVSSKVVSKSLGLWADSADLSAAVASQTVPFVLNRRRAVVSGKGCAQCRQRSGTTGTISSTRSSGSNAR